MATNISDKMDAQTSAVESNATAIGTQGKAIVAAIEAQTAAIEAQTAATAEQTAALNVIAEATGASTATEYGVGWIDGQSASAGVRFLRKNGVLSYGDAVTLQFTAGVGDTECVNDFEDCTDFPNFKPAKWTTAAGQFSRFQKFYYGTQKVGVYTVTWICAEKLHDFYKLPKAFSWNGVDGYWNYVDIGRYLGAEETVDGTIHFVSKPDLYCAHNRTRAEMQGYATNWNATLGLDSDSEYYHILTMSEYTEVLTPIIEVMLATHDVQTFYLGATAIYQNFLSIIAYETDEDAGTTTLYLTGSSTLRAGGTAMLLTTDSVADTAGSETNYAQVIDYAQESGTAVSGNSYSYVAKIDKTIDGTEGYSYVTAVCLKTGLTDYDDSVEWKNAASLKGESGCYLNNGYYPHKILGVENVWGNMQQNILDVTMYNYVPYVCRDLTSWAETSTPASNANFSRVGYSVVELVGSGACVTELGIDDDNPDVVLPTAVGGSTSTYYADYTYTNTGVRTVYVGGSLALSRGAGLRFWVLSASVGLRNWPRGSRLSHFSL